MSITSNQFCAGIFLFAAGIILYMWLSPMHTNLDWEFISHYVLMTKAESEMRAIVVIILLSTLAFFALRSDAQNFDIMAGKE